MPAMNLHAVGITDPAPLEGVRVIAAAQTDIDVFIIAGGMESGEPSVALVIEAEDHHGHGVIVVETSLGLLLSCAAGAQAMAEVQWGWERPL